MPRFASVHEESVSLVPQATSLAISARIDFSSTAARNTLPAGRGKTLGCGRAFDGSAGSRGTARCAKAGVPISPSATKQPAKTPNTNLQVLLDLFLMRFLPRTAPPNSPGILARLAIRLATSLSRNFPVWWPPSALGGFHALLKIDFRPDILESSNA